MTETHSALALPPPRPPVSGRAPQELSEASRGCRSLPTPTAEQFGSLIAKSWSCLKVEGEYWSFFVVVVTFQRILFCNNDQGLL